MPTTYFDSDGIALITVEALGLLPSPPSSAAYASEIVISNINEIYLDIDTLTVVEKPDFDIEVSRNLITNIPAGTTTIIGHDVDIISDGTIEFEADVTETVHVRLSHPHYRELTLEVETGP